MLRSRNSWYLVFYIPFRSGIFQGLCDASKSNSFLLLLVRHLLLEAMHLFLVAYLLISKSKPQLLRPCSACATKLPRRIGSIRLVGRAEPHRTGRTGKPGRTAPLAPTVVVVVLFDLVGLNSHGSVRSMIRSKVTLSH